MSSDAPEPTGLIADKGLELLTFGTPNGHKITIFLEELKEAYGRDYVYQSVNIMKNTQKEPWFTKLGPNGRIPVLIDHDKGGLSIQEGSAILAYLARHYDTENRFSFKEDPQLSHQEQWIAWQHGGLGPMQGQANHFFRLAKERIPYPTQRYVGETERLMGILDNQLKDNSYLVGNKYSIADIANYSWVNLAYFSGVNLAQFPNLEKWWKSINGRPAVQKGQSIPGPSPYTNDNFQQKLKDDKEFADKNAELEKLRDEAKKQYDYKYSSP
ncbi:glutathione S-transferase [Aureobasidium pullulans]|uniref:Glutathione S-transferase n=1 Tax=Aureobasidium pullulans TaxID=5580 RepID=A0A4S9XI88_AURPU|nr:glutathione S-transferase [Aureobasidium pullulans]